MRSYLEKFTQFVSGLSEEFERSNGNQQAFAEELATVQTQLLSLENHQERQLQDHLDLKGFSARHEALGLSLAEVQSQQQVLTMSIAGFQRKFETELKNVQELTASLRKQQLAQLNQFNDFEKKVDGLRAVKKAVVAIMSSLGILEDRFETAPDLAALKATIKETESAIAQCQLLQDGMHSQIKFFMREAIKLNERVEAQEDIQKLHGARLLKLEEFQDQTKLAGPIENRIPVSSVRGTRPLDASYLENEFQLRDIAWLN